MVVMLASAGQLGFELRELLLCFAPSSFLSLKVKAFLEGLASAFTGEVVLELYAVRGVIQDYLCLLESAFKLLI